MSELNEMSVKGLKEQQRKEKARIYAINYKKARPKLWSLMVDDEIREWFFSLGKMGDSVNDVMHRIKEKGYSPPVEVENK